jgi:hypothetical protein
VKLLEFLARACDFAEAGEHREVMRRAVVYTLQYWPRVGRFTDGHLAQIRLHLKGGA